MCEKSIPYTVSSHKINSHEIYSNESTLTKLTPAKSSSEWSLLSQSPLQFIEILERVLVVVTRLSPSVRKPGHEARDFMCMAMSCVML